MSADVCLNQMLRYPMEMTLTTRSCCTVSVTIPDFFTVRRKILLCSR